MRERWKEFWRRHPFRLTRKQKILRNILCVLLLLVVSYRLLDCPALGPVHAFRQAERQNLAEKSRIMANIPGEDITLLQENLEQFGERDPLGALSGDWVERDLKQTKAYIVGEKDGEFYCFWCMDDGTGWLDFPTYKYLLFHEKTGDVTVMPLQRYISENRLTACILCVQTDMEDAVYAYAEAREVRGYTDGKYYTNWCSGEGTVRGDGIFIIAAYRSAEPTESTQEEYEAMKGLLEIRVVLKNAAGDVIWEESRIV